MLWDIAIGVVAFGFGWYAHLVWGNSTWGSKLTAAEQAVLDKMRSTTTGTTT